MKQTTRELLVTTKAAQSWQDAFDSNVDELMSLVSKVDTEEHVDSVTELLNVYHNSIENIPHLLQHKKDSNKPFEFIVFNN